MARGMALIEPNVFRYLFSRHRANSDVLPVHGDEIPYVFGHLAVSDRNQTALFDTTDEKISQEMMNAWVRFAETGNPNGGSVRLPQYDATSDSYIEFGDEIRPASGLRTAKLDFLETAARRLSSTHSLPSSTTP